MIQNTGGEEAEVTLYFRGRTGYPDLTPRVHRIGKNSQLIQYTDESNWVGSLEASSTQPLAITIQDETLTINKTRTYNAASWGQSKLFMPCLYRNYLNTSSSIVVQNLHSTLSQNAVVNFYDRLGNFTTSYTLAVPPSRSAGVNLTNIPNLPDNWAGSGIVISDIGQSLVATVYGANNGPIARGEFTYTAATHGSSVVTLPYVLKNQAGLLSNYLLMNVSDGSILVTAYYYNQGGGNPIYSKSFTLSQFDSQGNNLNDDTSIANGWVGSIVLTVTDGAPNALVAISRTESSNASSASNGVGR